MLPGHALRDTITIWNLTSRGPAEKDTFQRTVVARTQCNVEDQRILDNAGNYRTAEVLTARIDIRVSEASGGRKYMPHNEWGQEPSEIGKHWTIRPGFDYIARGDVPDDAPPTSGRKVYKVRAMFVRRTPDGRGIIRVVAT